MNTRNKPPVDNEASRLLDKMHSAPIDRLLSKKNRESHRQVCEIAGHATQLLNSVASTGALMTSPNILGAKTYHRQITQMATNLKQDMTQVRATLLELHTRYVTVGEKDLREFDQWTYLIQAYQGYEQWIEYFQGAILPQAAALSDLLIEIDQKVRGASNGQ